MLGFFTMSIHMHGTDDQHVWRWHMIKVHNLKRGAGNPWPSQSRAILPALGVDTRIKFWSMTLGMLLPIGSKWGEKIIVQTFFMQNKPFRFVQISYEFIVVNLYYDLFSNALPWKKLSFPCKIHLSECANYIGGLCYRQSYTYRVLQTIQMKLIL